MSIASILAELDAEISKLERARAMLGNPTISKAPKQNSVLSAKGPQQRKISADARERIAAAQRKRWAEQKAAKTEPAKSAPATKRAAPKMSAAGRKRIAAAQKKRWAAIKADKRSQKNAPTKKTGAVKVTASKKSASPKGKRAVPEKTSSAPTGAAIS